MEKVVGLIQDNLEYYLEPFLLREKVYLVVGICNLVEPNGWINVYYTIYNKFLKYLQMCNRVLKEKLKNKTGKINLKTETQFGDFYYTVIGFEEFI